MSARNTFIDLGLEVIETVRQPGECLSPRAIAEVCGCTANRILQIEHGALKKLRRAHRARTLKEEGLG